MLVSRKQDFQNMRVGIVQDEKGSFANFCSCKETGLGIGFEH